MGIKNISDLLGLEKDSELANATSKFLEQVKEYMVSAQNKPSSKHVKAEEHALKMLYQHFFEFAMQWTVKEQKKHKGSKDHPNAVPLKEQAIGVVEILQKNIINFSLCYMRLNRSIGLIQDELGKSDQEPNKSIRWGKETSQMITRHRKERSILLELNGAISKGLPLLEKNEECLSVMAHLMRVTLGDNATEVYMRSFRSALRISDFTRANKILKTISSAKKKRLLNKNTAEKNIEEIIKAGSAYVSFIEKEAPLLTGIDGKMFLQSQEIKVAITAQEKEIITKTQYIKKYHRPYMEYKLKSIMHLKDKLLIVGSLDSLTTLFLRLLRGMSSPLTDIKTIRQYEEEVLQYIDYLLSGQFTEVDKIGQWSNDSMDEFHKGMSEFSA